MPLPYRSLPLIFKVPAAMAESIAFLIVQVNASYWPIYLLPNPSAALPGRAL